jgi:hypothetical protein
MYGTGGFQTESILHILFILSSVVQAPDQGSSFQAATKVGPYIQSEYSPTPANENISASN